MSSDRYERRPCGPIPLDYEPQREKIWKTQLPYLHPDGTSILRAKPDHPATVEHLMSHGYTRGSIADTHLDMWHSMAHSEPRIETAITAALQLGSDWRHLTITGFEERYKDLLDLLGEAKEENDWLRGIIEQTIDYYREEPQEAVDAEHLADWQAQQ